MSTTKASEILDNITSIILYELYADITCCLDPLLAL